MLLVGGPAIIHTGAGPYLAELVRDGYVNAIFAGNAQAVHDMESQFFGTSLGVNLHDVFPAEEGHVHHPRTVNRIRAAGGNPNAIESGMLTGGVMYEAHKKHIPVLLAGSIRDDGPIPDVIHRMPTRDAPLRARDRHGAHGLHASALDRHRQSAARHVQDDSVDINPSSATKLTDRGSHETLGIVMGALSFLRELTLAMPSNERRCRRDWHRSGFTVIEFPLHSCLARSVSALVGHGGKKSIMP